MTLDGWLSDKLGSNLSLHFIFANRVIKEDWSIARHKYEALFTVQTKA